MFDSDILFFTSRISILFFLGVCHLFSEIPNLCTHYIHFPTTFKNIYAIAVLRSCLLISITVDSMGLFLLIIDPIFLFLSMLHNFLLYSRYCVWKKSRGWSITFRFVLIISSQRVQSFSLSGNWGEEWSFIFLLELSRSESVFQF